jgi:predicted nucleic acid-binding protein
MIHIDTSALIDALTGRKRSEPRLREFIESAERVHISALVLFEWRRGPRTPEEIEDQEELFPESQIVPFGPEEAALASELYRKIRKPRGREIDIAIAACAITQSAKFWTLNRADFKDLPDLDLA